MPIGPTIAAGGTAVYGTSAVAIDPSLTLSDTESTTLVGATVSIGGFLAGDELSFSAEFGITGSYDASTGVLTLSGTASVADYQAVMQSVTYSFSGADPFDAGTDLSRTFSYAVNDGTSASNAPVTLATGLGAPEFVAVDPSGNVWVTVAYSNPAPGPGVTESPTLFELVNQDGSYSSPVGFVPSSSGGLPTGIAFDASGNVYTGELPPSMGPGGDQGPGLGINELQISTLQVSQFFSYGTIPGSTIAGLATAPSGDIFAIDTFQNNIFDTNTLETVYTGGSGENLSALAFDSSGNLFFTDDYFDSDDGVIKELTAASDYATVVTLPYTFEAPYGVAVDANGDVFVVDEQAGTLTELTGPNYATAFTIATGLDAPQSVAVGSSGNIFVVEGTGVLVEIAAPERSQLVFGQPVITAGASVVFRPGGIPVAPDPGLAIADNESATLNGAVVAITAGFLAGDELSFVSQNGITGASAAGTGVLTLTGTATVAEYQAALQSITFSSTAADPTAGGTDEARTISWTVSDGTQTSAMATSTLTAAPSIIGTVANQATTSEAPVDPFAGVVIGDGFSVSGASETLTIALGGAGGVLSGTGLSGGTDGIYSLTGTAAAVTSALQALSFTPTGGGMGTVSTTTFTLIDQSSAYATPVVDARTSVIDTDPGVAPTIGGTVADQATTSEAPVDPFSNVTIEDPNPGATDTLTITLGGAGGTLSGNGLSGGTGGVWTLSGTAGAVTGELDALVFTPRAGTPGSQSTTTFALNDQSSAPAAAVVDTTTSVVDADPALAPPAQDFMAYGQSDILIEDSQTLALVVGQTNNYGRLAYTQVGRAAASWTFGGSGDFLGDGKSQYLVETSTGQVMLGEVGSSGLASYVTIGGLGPEWSFEGTGDFLGEGFDQFLIESASGAVDVGTVGSGGAATYVQVGALGPEWRFLGAGDFYGDGKAQFLIENTNGAIVLGEVGSNDEASYAQIGGLGPEWACEGVGDFLADGSDQFLLENTNGTLDLGWVGANGKAAYEQIGGLGSEWSFVGVGDYGGTGQSSFLIESTAGTVVTGTVMNGKAQYAEVGGLGSVWSFCG